MSQDRPTSADSSHRSLHSRRSVLALAGVTLGAGCLASTSGDGPSKPGSGSTDDSGDSNDESTAGPAAWPQVGKNPGHTGYNPEIDGTGSGVRWKRKGRGPLTTPTVADGTVYLTRGKLSGGAPKATLEAYDLESGDQQWSHSLGVTYRFSAPNANFRPIHHGGTIYVGVGESIRAFDADTRDKQWGASVGQLNDPPVVTDDAVYAGGMDALTCLNHDGSERWQFTPDGMVSTRIPAVRDGTVYGLDEEGLVALAADDGSEQWHHQSDVFGSSVVATEDVVVLAGRTVEAIEPDGESRRWKSGELAGAVIRPSVANDTVYVAELTGNVTAFDLESGDRRWRTHLPPSEYTQGALPMVTAGTVSVLRTINEEVKVYSLDWDTGKTQKTITKRGTRGRGPILANDSVVFTVQHTPPKQRQNKTVSEGLDTDSWIWTYDV